MNDAVMRLVKAIRELACPSGILLYGAKQDLAETDGLKEINLCLIVEEDPSGVEQKLYRSLESDLAFNLLVYERKAWQTLVTDDTSYAAGIARKGILLYGTA